MTLGEYADGHGSKYVNVKAVGSGVATGIAVVGFGVVGLGVGLTVGPGDVAGSVTAAVGSDVGEGLGAGVG